MISGRPLFILVLALPLIAAGVYYLHIQKNPDQAQGDLFTTACITPVLGGEKNIGEACRSLQGIKETYNIDIKAVIDDRYQKMADTARRIASGELREPHIYKACIARNECAEVPLVDVDIDPAKMTAEQEAASTAFWDLAEKNKITEPVCALIPECQAMVKLEVIDYGFKADR